MSYFTEFPHYEVIWLQEHARRAQLTPRQVVFGTFGDLTTDYKLNWLFIGTSGVHGNSCTLDEIEESLTETAEETVTVLIVLPRACVMYYGNIQVFQGDIPKLREFVSKTLESVRKSQEGNLPKGVETP